MKKYIQPEDLLKKGETVFYRSDLGISKIMIYSDIIAKVALGSNWVNKIKPYIIVKKKKLKIG
jgi:hypothetical protein